MGAFVLVYVLPHERIGMSPVRSAQAYRNEPGRAGKSIEEVPLENGEHLMIEGRHFVVGKDAFEFKGDAIAAGDKLRAESIERLRRELKEWMKWLP